MPEIRRVLSGSIHQARAALASLFLNQEETAIDERTARTAGGFYHALLSGLISQFLIDPEHALSARDLRIGLETASHGLLSARQSRKKQSVRTRKKPEKRSPQKR
jgi:hypothetical protein